LLLAEAGALLAEEALARLVDSAVEARHAGGEVDTAKVHVHALHALHAHTEVVRKVHV